MEEIIKDKISADHLLYVSLKYTKTCDVIINLLLRWARMIELGINETLLHYEETGKIDSVPKSPLEKVQKMEKLFVRNKEMRSILNLYKMFRRVNELRTKKSGEFRKNVNLKIFYAGKEVNVDLEKLKEYAALLEKFISKISIILK